jgi:mevalonate kinase
MHTPAHGRAGGKVILLGEHVVVYGRPAFATGVPLALDATIDVGAGPRLVSDAPADPRATRLVAEAARAMGLDPSRIVAHVRSEIPPARGLGSSAALSIAVLRAMAAAAERTLDGPTTLGLGRELERIFHGTPSGVDPAAAALGTCLRFLGGEPPEVTPVRLARRLRLVVAYGDRARSTRSAVAGLRERWSADRARYERLFDEVARTVEEGIAAARRGDLDALGVAFDRNQTLLEELGVSNAEIAHLVRVARGAGAVGAKLTGGGAGGAIIALARDVDEVAHALARAGATALVIEVGDDDNTAAGHPRPLGGDEV